MVRDLYFNSVCLMMAIVNCDVKVIFVNFKRKWACTTLVPNNTHFNEETLQLRMSYWCDTMGAYTWRQWPSGLWLKYCNETIKFGWSKFDVKYLLSTLITLNGSPNSAGKLLSSISEESSSANHPMISVKLTLFTSLHLVSKQRILVN